ncbi:MAG TPA: ArgE/DapE family deacylase [Acidimicrobiales bacterium]|nr:ArgE/DapE family deacylase [Acidimicrobiales bacterium]
MHDDLRRLVHEGVEQVRPAATDLVRQLVATPSITGDEAAAQQVVAEALADLGLEVDAWSPTREELAEHPSFSDDGLALGDRPVVVGRLAGATDAPPLVLNGHVDVVPVGDEAGWPVSPWNDRLDGSVLRGRGTCDMKGGLVAGIAAVHALLRLGLEPPVPVLVQSVIGEETGGVGTLAAVLRGHTGAAAIVLEPTRLHRCPVGAGAASFRLHVPGRAAHGAMRAEGVSAVDKFVPLLAAMAELERARHADFEHPAYGPHDLVAPISVGRVSSGDWPSTVPEALVAEGRFGVLPGETLDEARRRLEATIADTAATDDWLAAHPPVVEWFEGQFAPALTPVDHPLIAAVGAAHDAVVGTPSPVHGVPYGSDLRFFTNDADMPAVLYGPGDVAVAHTVDEHVDLDEVFAAAEVVALTILGWEPSVEEDGR